MASTNKKELQLQVQRQLIFHFFESHTSYSLDNMNGTGNPINQICSFSELSPGDCYPNGTTQTWVNTFCAHIENRSESPNIVYDSYFVANIFFFITPQI